MFYILAHFDEILLFSIKKIFKTNHFSTTLNQYDGAKKPLVAQENIFNNCANF